MDEEGAFKTAGRGGRWPDWKTMLAESVNEQYRMRASYHAAHSTDDNDVRFDPAKWYVLDPVDRELRSKAAEEEAKDVQQSVDEFNAELGFS